MRRGLTRYTRPYLALSEVLRQGETLELRGTFGGEARLTTDASNHTHLLSLVSALRDPCSDEWRALTGGAAEKTDAEGAMALVQQLDAHGLIAEAEVPDVEQARTRVERAYRDAVAVLARVDPETLRGAAEAVRDAPIAIRKVLGSGAQGASANFYTQALAVQATYLCQQAPVSAWLAAAALDGALRGEQRFPHPVHGEEDSPGAEAWSAGLFSAEEVARDLAAFCELIRRSRGSDALRRMRLELPVAPSRQAGSNFILALEHAVGRALAREKRHPSDYVPPGREGAFLRVAFLQEYHVTVRFTTCIAPLIAKQLPMGLTRALERYFSEEIGHERFELSNCLRLGLSEAQVLASTPLPLHRVFVDCLIAAASQSPVVCFCSTLFTEGLVGTSTSLLDFVQSSAEADESALKRELSRHVGLNDSLNHRYVGREWMSFVPSIDARLAALTADWVSFLLEFNLRMWSDVADAARAEPA